VAVPVVDAPMSNYRAVMEVAWLVRDVDTMDDAIGIAVSEAGRRLNEADLQYVDIEVGLAECPACGEPFDAGFLAASTALVGLVLELTVFNAESEEHAARIAKSEVGGALRNVPLDVIETIEEPEDEAADAQT
jgi:uncharacterized protein (UPF0212 family)